MTNDEGEEIYHRGHRDRKKVEDREEGSGSTELGRSSPHLWAAVAVAVTLVVGCVGVEGFVRWRLRGCLEEFAGIMPPVKLTGNVLPTAAFGRQDFLVVYGSSELDHDAGNRPDAFFARRPTGFVAFPIGKAGCTCLINAVKLAALSDVLRGKKVVVMLSPTWFLRSFADPEAVAANLRPAQLAAWVFGDGLSDGLKRRIAGYLELYPAAREIDPLLGSALRVLEVQGTKQASVWDRVEWALLKPLGRTESFLLRRAEFWAIWHDLPGNVLSHRQRQQSARRGELSSPEGPPDWEQRAAQAEAFDRARGDASPYSVGTPERAERAAGEKGEGRGGAAETDKGIRPPSERDFEFAYKLRGSSEWLWLQLLLEVVRESGGEALVISQPFNGRYRDAGGETAAARRAYYEQLNEVVKEAGFVAKDFSEHEEDRTFFNDAGHPSAKAWVFYDRAMDDFFHERTDRKTSMGKAEKDKAMPQK